MNLTHITSKDNECLRRMLAQAPFCIDRRRERNFLRNKLDRAFIVADTPERPSMIRLGSTFEVLDRRTGSTKSHTLCLPNEVLRVEGGLSVDSRLGVEAFGCNVGDEIRWETAAGSQSVLIRDVRPPRSATETRQTILDPSGVS
ncbi:MAG TPA: GreA/GreB family elongation factor [Opitutaceae bacterium]|nr:GreA/GreB family elongation factor [Opitutaceae bacterium]